MVRSAQVDTSLLSRMPVPPANWIVRQGCITQVCMAGIRRAGVGEKTVLDGRNSWQMLIEEARLIAPGADGVKSSVIYCRVRTLAGKE